MATAELAPDGTRIHIYTVPTDKDRMVQIPGAAWHRPVWWVPATWAACVQLRALFGADLQLGPQLVAWAWRERAAVQSVSTLRSALELSDADDIATTLDKVEKDSTNRLRPFQRAAVAYLVAVGQAGLFDAMGSGKTPTLIRTLQVLHRLDRKPWPALIVCPSSVKFSVWQRQFALWAPELDVTVVDGSASQRRKQFPLADDCCAGADVWVVSWELLRLHSRLAPFGNTTLTDAQRTPKELQTLDAQFVVLDEAHRLRTVGTKKMEQDDGSVTRTPTSQQALAAWAVLHQARYRYVLTGTPADRNVADMWGLFHGIRPDWFPTKTKFTERYADTGYSLWGHREVYGLRDIMRAEYHAITEPLYRRIPQEITMPQLPPVLPPEVRETPLTPKQERAYREMESKMIALLSDDHLLIAGDTIEQFTRLRQLACASAEIGDDGKVKMIAPSSKVDDMVELLTELDDEPLVVTAESRQLIELAAERLRKERITHSTVTGAVAPIDRATAVERFQQGHTRVILLTFATGAEGLTLTRSRRMLMMQTPWSPMTHDQLRGRIRRFGSEHHEWVQYLYQQAPGTVDERAPKVLEGKEKQIAELLRDREIVKLLLGMI